MKRQLHIVCLDVPWPADYGAAIDMLNRIRMLHESGVSIHLHYFSYNERGQPAELKQFCESVNVYSRKTGWSGFSFSTPYIVQSRINKELIAALSKDDHPILLEGIHCTGVLPHLNPERKIVVRMHNEESTYYREMAKMGTGLLKKIYYFFESRLLNKYSHRLPAQVIYACISEKDREMLKAKYGLTNSKFLAAFPAWQKVSGNEGVGSYCLYHGNLSVAENEKAATWLLEKVFNRVGFPLIIAGKRPSQHLKRAAARNPNCELVADPSENKLDELIGNAQVNVLPCATAHATGIRLKLLHALFHGRHCLVNESMVAGTGLEPACHIGKNADAFASIITQLFHQPFPSEEIELRIKLLGDIYNNKKNAEQLIAWLY